MDFELKLEILNTYNAQSKEDSTEKLCIFKIIPNNERNIQLSTNFLKLIQLFGQNIVIELSIDVKKVIVFSLSCKN